MSELFNNVKVGDTVHYLTPQGQNGKGKVVIKHESGSHVVVNRGKGQPQVVNDKNYVKHERGGKVIGALLSKLAQYDKNAKATATVKEGAEKDPREAEWEQERKEGRAAATRHLNYQQSVLKSQDDLSFAKQKKRLAQKAALKKEDAALVAKNKKYVDNKMNKAYMKRSGEAWERVHKQKPGIITRMAARMVGTKLDKSGKVVEDRRVEGPYGGHPYDWDPELRKQIFAAAAKRVGKSTGPKDNGRVYKPNKLGPPPRRGTTSESAILGAVAIGAGIGVVGSALAIKAGHYLANRSVDRDNKRAEAEAKVKKGTSTGMPATGRPGTAAKKNATGGYHSKNQKGVERHFSDKKSAKEWLKSEDASEAEGRGARIAKTKKKKKLHEISSALKKRYVAAASKDIGNSESEAKKHGNSEYGNKMYAKARKRYDGITKSMKKVTEAEESKYKKAAEKIVLAKKNAKGNKHVDTKPSLNIPDKGTGGPLEGSETGERNDKLS